MQKKIQIFMVFFFIFLIVKNNCKYKKGLGNAHSALCSTSL
jgi:hypothetical protein